MSEEPEYFFTRRFVATGKFVTIEMWWKGVHMKTWYVHTRLGLRWVNWRMNHITKKGYQRKKSKLLSYEFDLPERKRNGF